MEHYDIFISYKRNDKEKVFAIKDYIEKNVGTPCWIDLDGIESGAQFANVIIKAINDSQVFLFMYSASHAEIEDLYNDWTVREITFAQRRKKRIVFINIDGTPLTDWFDLMFGTNQQVDATTEEGKEKLCKDLKKWLKAKSLGITSNTVGKPSSNNKSIDMITDWLQKSDPVLKQNDLMSAIIPIALATQMKTKFREHEWNQVIRDCKKYGQMDVLESDKVVDALDLGKLFDVLLDKHVSEKVLEQVGTCRTIGDLKKLLVSNVDK